MTTETRTPVQRAALEALEMFVLDKRDDGSEFWKVETGEPYDIDHWVTRLCMSAHGDMMPDDHRYRFIREALSAIAYADDTDEARDTIEADIYTSTLLHWVASSIDRVAYVDSAVEDFGHGEGLVDQLSAGQRMEKDEVFDSVLSSLEARAEAVEDEDEEDDDGDA